MARPPKSGVDYFSHDVGAHNRRTLSALRSRFGNDGYAFWYILLEVLGEQTTLSLDCSDEINWIYLCTETAVSEVSAAEILELLSRMGAIDKNLWQNHRIIWCQSFVDRLESVYKKRREQIPVKPEPERVEGLFENVSSEVSAPKTHVSASESTQSKVKESKVNKSKVKQLSNTKYVSTDNSTEDKSEIYAAALKLFEKRIGIISPSLQERICALVDDVGLDFYKMAIEKAVQKGSVHIGYVEAAAFGIKHDTEQKGDRQNGIDRKAGRDGRASPQEPPKLGNYL